MMVKGKGLMRTYWVQRRPQEAPPNLELSSEVVFHMTSGSPRALARRGTDARSEGSSGWTQRVSVIEDREDLEAAGGGGGGEGKKSRQPSLFPSEAAEESPPGPGSANLKPRTSTFLADVEGSTQVPGSSVLNLNLRSSLFGSASEADGSTSGPGAANLKSRTSFMPGPGQASLLSG